MASRAALGSNDVTDHYLLIAALQRRGKYLGPQLSNAAQPQRQTEELTAVGGLRSGYRLAVCQRSWPLLLASPCNKVSSLREAKQGAWIVKQA